MRRRRSLRSSMYPFSSRYDRVSDSRVISRAEVSPKSSFVTSAATPAGSCILNAARPCLIFDHTSSLSFTSSFSSTIT